MNKFTKKFLWGILGLVIGALIVVRCGIFWNEFQREIENLPNSLDFSPPENYSIVKEKSEGFLFSGRAYFAIVEIKNPRFVEELCDYIAENFDCDAYLLSEFFLKDAQDFAAGTPAKFSEKSRTFSGNHLAEWYRVMLSDDEHFAYIHVFRN